MFEVVIRGFHTKAQAKAFVSAYEGIGEQTMAEISEESENPFPTQTVMCAGWMKCEGNQVIITVA